MASETLSYLMWGNLTLCAGIAVVLALRLPVRRWAGAQVAYLLWIIPLLSFTAWLLPVQHARVTLRAILAAAARFEDPAFGAGLERWAVAFWLIGMMAVLATFVVRQRGLQRALAPLVPARSFRGRVYYGAIDAGPVVIGALRPAIVLPKGFADRFTAPEQALVLAHEHAHVTRRDPLVNAISSLICTINWFNPLVAAGCRALRMDQELACDAAVLANRQGARRTYAEAILKSHALTPAAPLAAAWRSRAFQSVKERLEMIAAPQPSLQRNRMGRAIVLTAATVAVGLVWFMRPVDAVAMPLHSARDAACWRALARQIDISQDWGTLSLGTLTCIGSSERDRLRHRGG